MSTGGQHDAAPTVSDSPTIPANLIVDQTGSTIEVTAPGRFRLVFDRAYEWQAIGWYDLASDPSRDLVGKHPTDGERRVLQGLLAFVAGAWRGASEGTNPTISGSNRSGATADSSHRARTRGSDDRCPDSRVGAAPSPTLRARW